MFVVVIAMALAGVFAASGEAPTHAQRHAAKPPLLAVTYASSPKRMIAYRVNRRTIVIREA